MIIELSNRANRVPSLSLVMMEISSPSEAECNEAQKEGRKGDIDCISS